MEMPMDVLNKRLGQIRDNGDIDFDNTAAAIDIDIELQEKFLFFPLAELDAIEIEDDRGVLHAGDGPEHCQARPGENPNWLFNHAMNAMALYRRLKETERLELEQRDIERKRHELIAKRPAPGVYTLNTARSGHPYVVAVTADRRIIDLNRTGKCTDFTDVFDGLDNKSVWTFTAIETGLSA